MKQENDYVPWVAVLILGCFIIPLALIVGSRLGKHETYEQSCESACVRREAESCYHAGSLCVADETVLHSDLGQMWVEKK